MPTHVIKKNIQNLRARLSALGEDGRDIIDLLPDLLGPDGEDHASAVKTLDEILANKPIRVIPLEDTLPARTGHNRFGALDPKAKPKKKHNRTGALEPKKRTGGSKTKSGARK